MQRIGLIGAGLIGRGWAVVFARAGHEVLLWDRRGEATEAALAAVTRSLDDMATEGLLRESPSVVRGRVRAAHTLEEAVRTAAYVQESVTEDRQVKAAVFTELDHAAPRDAVLASSASAIPASQFTEDLAGRSRCIVAHPANPPHVMPVVELVPAPWTQDAVVRRTSDILGAAGQVPVVLHREIPGFVMNRLQTAVIGEAMYLVGTGVVSPDDLDKVMRYSLGMRWSFMGPFETMELNAPGGFLDYTTKFRGSYAEMAHQLHVADPWAQETLELIEAARRNKYSTDKVPERQTWRDRRLMALLRHIEESDGRFGK